MGDGDVSRAPTALTFRHGSSRDSQNFPRVGIREERKPTIFVIRVFQKYENVFRKILRGLGPWARARAHMVNKKIKHSENKFFFKIE